MPSSDLHITAWVDPVVDDWGHAVYSAYFELFWLPVLGPSSTCFVRRANLYLKSHPGGLSIDPVEVSLSLGIGPSQSRHGPLPKAIERSVKFGMVRRTAPRQLAVRQAVGQLPEHHVARLPPTLRKLHSAWAGKRDQSPLSRESL
jgi:hypothetical protein